MAPFSGQGLNKPRSIESGLASTSSMSPEVIALICSSVLIFLDSLSSATVLTHRQLRHRTQAQDLAPLASESKEKVEDVFSPTSNSSKSLAAEPLLLPLAILRPTSTTMTEDLDQKLMSKASAALSKDDRYTTLPLRRFRQARQSRIEEKNSDFDPPTPLAALGAEIVNSETARRYSHRFSSVRSISLTSGTSSSTHPSTHSKSQTCSIGVSSGTGDQCATRPSPTIISMEARPLETDMAALPDAGMMFVAGSIPSFSNISSAISLSTTCEAVVVGHTTPEADEVSKLSTGLERKTPRQREHRAHAEKRTSGSPSSSSTSISTALTAHDTTFSSDADLVSEVGSCEASINDKPFKFCDALSLPISAFDITFDLPSSRGDDVIGLHPADVLNSGDTKPKHGNLTPFVSADTFF